MSVALYTNWDNALAAFNDAAVALTLSPLEYTILPLYYAIAIFLEFSQFSSAQLVARRSATYQCEECH